MNKTKTMEDVARMFGINTPSELAIALEQLKSLQYAMREIKSISNIVEQK